MKEAWGPNNDKTKATYENMHINNEGLQQINRLGAQNINPFMPEYLNKLFHHELWKGPLYRQRGLYRNRDSYFYWNLPMLLQTV